MTLRQWKTLGVGVACGVAAAACEQTTHMPSPVSPAFAVADSLRSEGRAAAAVPRYLALSDSFAQVHDTASWWRAQLWLSQGLLSMGRREDGLRALATATALAGSDPDRVGWTRYARSIFQDRVGHFDSALAETEGARDLALRSHDPRLEAAAYHAMGRIHSLSGRYRAALAANQRALALDHSYGASARQISLELNELGIDYRHLGRLTDAVAAYDSALAVERSLHSPEGIARVEYNLANVRMATGDAAGALGLLNDALARAQEIGEVRGMAFIHGGLADLHAQRKSYAAARQEFEQALAINRTARLPYGEVQNLEGLGRVDLAEHDAARAITVLRDALVIADSAHYGKERATVRAALARASVAVGDIRSARRWSDEAVRISDSLGDPAVQVESRGARGESLEAAGDPAAASAFTSAIDLLESWRGRLALGDLRMGVAESHLDVYEGAIRTLLAASRPEAAFRIAERGRARMLLELMAEHDIRDAPRSDEERVRLALRESYESRSQASPGDVALFDRVIDSLTRTLDSVEASARARDVQGDVHYPAPVGIAALRDTVLDGGSALLAYFWGERDVFGWWMTRDSLHAQRLGSADSLAAQLEFLHVALSGAQSGPAWQPAARAAYAELVAPLHPTRANDVFVVADGPLAYVPLESFIDGDGGAPWGATTRFEYGPSASVLLVLSRPPSFTEPPLGVLAVGDPTRATEGGASLRSADESPAGDLPDLPAAAQEARGIAKLVGGDVLVGEDASIPHWLARDPGRYRYLHFATHALLDEQQPQRSALLLADGRLDLRKIRRLRLAADLVTLSACETGLGPRTRGEGVIGLPHAFIQAGARAVVVSLWRVRDRDAARFMLDYYRELHTGRSPADAMLAVRQSRLRSASTASPTEWAAFVLIGGRR